MLKTINYRQAINDALTQEMRRDKRVIIYGLDITDHKRIFGSTKNILEEFGPSRCFGMPLSEDAMTGFGLGAAIGGLKPVYTHIRADFLFLCMNQLANMVSSYRYLTGGKKSIPFVIRAVMGRGWGQGAQHSKSIHSILAHFPGLKVVMPTHPADAKGLIVSAIRDNNPVIVLEHRWLYDTLGPVPQEENFSIKIGEPNFLVKGKHVTVIATSWMNIEAIKAAEILKKKQGIEVELIDARSIYPLSLEPIFKSVAKTGHCIVVDYDWLWCGFSAELAAQISNACFKKLKKPVQRLGFAHAPTPTTKSLEDVFYATSKNIIRSVEKLYNLKLTDLTKETFYSYEYKFKGPF